MKFIFMFIVLLLAISLSPGSHSNLPVAIFQNGSLINGEILGEWSKRSVADGSEVWERQGKVWIPKEWAIYSDLHASCLWGELIVRETKTVNGRLSKEQYAYSFTITTNTNFIIRDN